jgi:predicted permease
MNSILQDVGYSLRVFRKAPGFSLIAVATLAMGIGANTAIFSVVNAVLLSPLPFDHPDELVVVGGQLPGIGSQDITASGPEYRDYIEQATSLSGLAATWNIDANITNGERPERWEVVLTSWNLFSMLRASPELGRDFKPEDAGGDIGYVAIISHAAWQRLFSGDSAVIGMSLRLDDDPITVVGVMPEGFVHPGESAARPVEAWVPIDLSPGTRFDNRNGRPLTLIGRRQKGFSLAQSQAEFWTIATNLEKEYPASYPADSGWTITVVPLLERVVGDVRTTLLVLFGSVGFVLLIACTNVANLILTRGAARRRELAIRSALGGGRGRIMRQLLIECLTLALVGGAVGLVVAAFGTSFLRNLASADFPRIETASIDGAVLLFTLAGSLVATVVAGLIPAWQLSNPKSQHLLNEGSRGSSAARGRTRDGLVVAQISISLVLLVSAGLLVKSFARLLAVDPGFDAERVLTMQTWLPWPNNPQIGRFFEPAQRIVLFDRVLDQMEALPEVARAGLVSDLPLRELNGAPFAIDGKDIGTAAAPTTAEFRIVSPNYFDVMGIPLVRGRGFETNDDRDNPPAVIISQAMADRYFTGEDPVGVRLRIGGSRAPWRDIIGIVGNVRHQALDVQPRETMYASYRQGVGLGMTFVLKTVAVPEAATQQATGALQAVDPELPAFAVSSMDHVVNETVAQRRLLMTLLSFFAVLALVLAAIGVYGVIGYAVKQRNREIGIRMALGADNRALLGMVLREGIALGSIGVVLGLVAATGLTRFLASMLFEVGSLDPVIFGGVGAVSIGVAALATFLPARRATRVDPVLTMKAE